MLFLTDSSESRLEFSEDIGLFVVVFEHKADVSFTNTHLSLEYKRSSFLVLYAQITPNVGIIFLVPLFFFF